MRHKYRTQFTCAMEIDFDLDGDVVSNIEFIGGCNGNLKAISKLVDGFTVEQIEQKLFRKHLRHEAHFMCRSACKSRSKSLRRRKFQIAKSVCENVVLRALLAIILLTKRPIGVIINKNTDVNGLIRTV